MPTKKAKAVGATKKAARSPVKSTVKKRSLNATPTKAKKAVGDPFNDQDAQRRLGNFTSAGEHARVGGRTSGIVGQTKQRFRTDKGKAK